QFKWEEPALEEQPDGEHQGQRDQENQAFLPTAEPQMTGPWHYPGNDRNQRGIDGGPAFGGGGPHDVSLPQGRPSLEIFGRPSSHKLLISKDFLRSSRSIAAACEIGNLPNPPSVQHH